MEAVNGSSANTGIKNNSDALVIISVPPTQKTKPMLFLCHSEPPFICHRIYRAFRNRDGNQRGSRLQTLSQ